MKTIIAYIIGFLACTAELLLYGFLIAYLKLDAKSFIGITILVIFITIMTWTWSFITKKIKKKKGPN